MDNQEPGTSPEDSSLGTTIANVFASPSEAFQGLSSTSPKATNWVLPMILMAALGVLFVYLIFSNDAIKTQIFDMQAQQFEKAVAEGRMTQQEADQVRDQMQKTGMGLFMVFGSLPILIFTAAYFFLGALFLWLASKILWKSPLKYGKYLEAYGIASWIGVLGSVVTMGMVLGMNSMFSTPSLGLLFADTYDATDTMHKFASAFNIFSVWQAVVTGIGLGSLAGKPVRNGIVIAVVLWLIWVAIGVPLGILR
ncbi:MAG: YIP1 family protein [Bacteroidota bacterium]